MFLGLLILSPIYVLLPPIFFIISITLFLAVIRQIQIQIQIQIQRQIQIQKVPSVMPTDHFPQSYSSHKKIPKYKIQIQIQIKTQVSLTVKQCSFATLFVASPQYQSKYFNTITLPLVSLNKIFLMACGQLRLQSFAVKIPEPWSILE